MGDLAVRAEGITKSYRISHQTGYRTLRETIVSAMSWPFRRDLPAPRETIWALKNVSFEVQRGEAMGIIGRNGAGKSTLLKILSRITRPTAGRADVYGRLGSLLEVGTGFHPELTGRENIFLNGAILGMSRRGIRRRFDEIVDFAETEQFLDTPVKRYSSGMYMRLAFAVAAHLESEILVIDEVLAVGDTAFQEKCLGKMEDIASQGRTILFVSHNMAAVAQLCETAILLDAGSVRAAGAVDDVVAQYLANASEVARIDLRDRSRRRGTGDVVFEWAELDNRDGEVCQDFFLGDEITLRFGLRLPPALPRTKVAVSLRAADGTPIAHIVDSDSGFVLEPSHETLSVSVRFDDIRLYPGSYYITLWVTDGGNRVVLDHAEDCLMFRIVEGGRLTLRPLPRHSGILFLTPRWDSRPESPSQAGRASNNEPAA